MKLLLIKIGKVYNAIQRDGLLGGLTKALRGIFTLLKTFFVFRGDILIITSGIGDSARYRAHHVAEELRLQGFRVSVTVQDNPLLPLYAKMFSVFIFHRTLYMGSVKKLFIAVKKKKKTVIFETDDLVHDQEYLRYMDFYKQMKKFEQLQYKDGVGGEILHDPFVKVATTTTSFLAQKLKEEGKKVFIVPNKLSIEDVRIAQKVLEEKKQSQQSGLDKDTEKIRIGYFSGTASHNKDFDTVREALLAILEKYKNVELYLAGPLDVHAEFDQFSGQIIREKWLTSKESYFRAHALCDIVLAPLEIGNPFCESKSEIKFLEASIVSAPVVAAATQTYHEAIEHGTDGFVAGTTEEWTESLEGLIVDRELRERLGEQARKKVIEKYTTENASNEEYYEFLRKHV